MILVKLNGEWTGDPVALAASIAAMVNKDHLQTKLISALEAEIRVLREERRWIPVGERLPPDEEWVDVAGRWGDCLGWHDGEEWRNVEEDPFPSEVTHWRKRGPGPEVKA